MRTANKAVFLMSLGLALGMPAMADDFPVCPSLANTGGFGSDLFSNVGCSETETIDVNTDYARLEWDSSTTGYPANVTLGNLGGIDAGVAFTADQASDQPYYELAFTDLSDSLGQGAAGDQILMLEFQSSTVSGSDMAFDPNSTLVNLYDNNTGVYLAGGQSDAHTLAYWLSTYAALDNESLQQIRLGIGLAGPGAIGSSAESLTVNSLDITAPAAVPEPRPLPLLLIVGAVMGWGIQRRQARIRRSN